MLTGRVLKQTFTQCLCLEDDGGDEIPFLRPGSLDRGTMDNPVLGMVCGAQPEAEEK